MPVRSLFLRDNNCRAGNPVVTSAPSVDDRTPPRQVAVIDIGSTSIRMAVGEIGQQHEVRKLETLAKPVSVGRDTFTQGAIRRSTIEACVRVLKSYRQILKEYQIERPDQIRVVATSAVREATNRLAFVDRIYIATGLRVEPLDEAEVTRVTYMGVQRYLRDDPTLTESKTIVTEVGGGHTELLIIKQRNVLFSQTYRLGSLRLLKMLETYRAPAFKLRAIMESQIRKTVEQMLADQPEDVGPLEMLAIGGDMRFAAAHLLPEWKQERAERIPLETLEAFTNRILSRTQDQIVRQYHVSFPDAETVGPALLAYVMLAKALKLPGVLVTNTNLRDGLLHEMALREGWTDEFRQQIIRSAIDLGRKFEFDVKHAMHVAELSSLLFRALQNEHRLEARYATILYVSALLHEIGLFVSNQAYHKHTMYLIKNSDLFGLGQRDVLLVALVARYHRRSSPQPTHEGYATLDRDTRVAVAKLAAILRLADALDDSRSGRIKQLDCSVEDDRFCISVPNIEDVSLEQLAMRQNSTMFEETYGMPVLLRPTQF